MDRSLIIEADGLTKRYRNTKVVSGVDLAVARGTCFGFLGHNGAGKTTVIRMLLGLARPDAGRVRIAGHSVLHDPARALARVGAVVEQPHFHPDLTGRENLEVFAAVRGRSASTRIDAALERVGLLDRARDRVGGYSQGMRQRLGIARCLLNEPHLLILDEPTNGLDPGGILELRQLMRDLVSEGRTVFLSSHLLDEIEKVCDEAVVLDRGRVIAQGPISELMGHQSATFDVVCTEPRRALGLLTGLTAVRRLRETQEGLRVDLHDPDGVGAVTAQLVSGGVSVLGVAPVRLTLEERFLRATSRVGERS